MVYKLYSIYCNLYEPFPFYSIVGPVSGVQMSTLQVWYGADFTIGIIYFTIYYTILYYTHGPRRSRSFKFWKMTGFRRVRRSMSNTNYYYYSLRNTTPVYSNNNNNNKNNKKCTHTCVCVCVAVSSSGPV